MSRKQFHDVVKRTYKGKSSFNNLVYVSSLNSKFTTSQDSRPSFTFQMTGSKLSF